MTQPIVHAGVARADYWFGQRLVAGAGSPASFRWGKVGDVFGAARVHGVAIAARSEVRAVRLRVDRGGRGGQEGRAWDVSGPSPWIELVEGSPLPIDLHEDDVLVLDRLDRHDGRLVLAAALERDAVLGLPVDVASISLVRLEGESLGAGGAAASVYLAPPRAAATAIRKAASTIRQTGAASQNVELFRAEIAGRSGELLWSESLGTTAHATATNVQIAETSLRASEHACFTFASAANATQAGTLKVY